jgi:hypothetical protein
VSWVVAVGVGLLVGRATGARDQVPYAITDLGAQAMPTAINGAGDVVGYLFVPNGNGNNVDTHAMSYSGAA